MAPGSQHLHRVLPARVSASLVLSEPEVIVSPPLLHSHVLPESQPGPANFCSWYFYLLVQETWDLVTQGCRSLRANVLGTAMEFQIHRPVLNYLELGDHKISSLGMEDIGGCLYPQASLWRRNLLAASSLFPEKRSPGHLLLQRDGRTSISFQTSPTCPTGQRSFPLRGPSLSPSGIPNHYCQHFGCDHSLLGCESC